MTKRTLAIGIALVGALGCGSSSNTANIKAPDGGGDAAKEAGNEAGPTDANDAGEGGSSLTAQQLRGQYLVTTVIGCPDCHTPMKADGTPDMSKFLAGNPNFVVLPNGDKLGSRNLTNDATGLKNRTDAEIKDMFLNGKRPITAMDGGAGGTGGTDAGAAGTDGSAAGSDAGDAAPADAGDAGPTDAGDAGPTDAAGEAGAGAGSSNAFLNPIMPYYVFHNMTEEDADAIVAYLRTVAGVNNEIPRRSASFDVPAPANPLDADVIPLPRTDYPARESALRGRYLAAQSGLCVECHTKHLPPGGPDVLDTTKLFQGGEDFSAVFAATLMIHPVSKNLTSDDATGLGTWTFMQVYNAIKTGKDKNGGGICPPMPTADYMNLTMDDATDIANYIKSLPAAMNLINDMCVFPPMTPDGGADGAEAGSEAGAEVGGDTSADTGEDAAGN
jgi:hypothetical protein